VPCSDSGGCFQPRPVIDSPDASSTHRQHWVRGSEAADGAARAPAGDGLPGGRPGRHAGRAGRAGQGGAGGGRAARGARARRRAARAGLAAGPGALRARCAAPAVEPCGGGAAALCAPASLLGLAPCAPGARPRRCEARGGGAAALRGLASLLGLAPCGRGAAAAALLSEAETQAALRDSGRTRTAQCVRAAYQQWRARAQAAAARRPVAAAAPARARRRRRWWSACVRCWAGRARSGRCWGPRRPACGAPPTCSSRTSASGARTAPANTGCLRLRRPSGGRWRGVFGEKWWVL